MRKLIPFYIIALFAVFVQTSCTRVNPNIQPVKKNLSNEYNPFGKSLHPIYRVYRLDSLNFRLYVKFFTNELTFNNANKDNERRAEVLLNYRIQESYQNTEIIDSATITKKIKTESSSSVINSFDIRHKGSKKFVLVVLASDKNSGIKSTHFIDVDFTKKDGFSDYMAFNMPANTPIFLGWLSPKQKTAIYNSRFPKQLHVKYYKGKFLPALPPHTSLVESRSTLKYDSIFDIVYTGKAEFIAEKEGIYRFQTDTTSNEGYALINFGKNFPLFQYSGDMVETLQYLLSTDQYADITEAPNKKMELDNFWIRCGGSDEKARELIRIWYSRATYANYYFSSYTQGWKTDRGMIYIVFGPPDSVNKIDGAERWQYSDSRGKILSFIFAKKSNPVSDNHYVLQRDYSYRQYWYAAIDSWLHGKVYSY